MKKLLTLLTLLLCVVGGAKASVYEWSYNGVFKSLSVTAAKGSSGVSKYEKYTISYIAADGTKYTCSTAVKMESATTLTFETAAKANITVGIVLKNGTTYAATGKATLKLDGVSSESAIDVETVGATTEDAVYVTFTDVAAGTHVIGRGGAELGVCYIRVEETGAVLTKLATPTITVNSSNGEVTIGSVTNASKITYTVDGSTPSVMSTEYTAPFVAEDGVMVKAIAIGDGETYSDSDIASQLVERDDVVIADPVIKQFNGTVALTCETASSTIEYSLNGTDYTTYARAFTLTEDATVYARAKRGTKYSEVVNAAVTTISKGAATKTLWIGHDMFDNNTKNSMTGKADTDAEGFTLAITGNDTKTWSYGSNDITTTGGVLQTIKLSNGAQNTLTLPAGLKATRITFYSVINSGVNRTSYWKEFQGTSINSDVPMGAWNDVADRLTNPDVRVFPLNGDETTITFTNAGEQLLFVIALDVLEPVEVTMPTSGLATLAANRALDFSSVDGLKAYVVNEVTKDAVALTEVTEIPANTGVILEGTASTKYSVPVAASAEAPAVNKLAAAVAATAVEANAAYILKDGLFHLVTTASTVPAGKAYLPATEVPAGARSLSIVAADETTGIEALESAENAEMSVYNLQGQRVQRLQKGLNIVNGKKVIVK